MRRWASRVALGLLLAVGVAFVPTVAHAGSPLPPPVDEVPFKSSSGVSATQQMIAMVTGGDNPRTPAGDWVRGVGVSGASKLIGGWFSAGFTAGATGVQVYAAVTGDNPLPGICDAHGAVQVASSVIYPTLGADCAAEISLPNEDQPVVITPLNYGGASATYSHSVTPAGWTYTIHCWKLSTTPWSVAPNLFQSEDAGYGSSVAMSTNTTTARCGSGAWRVSTSVDDSTRVLRIATNTGVILASSGRSRGNPTRTLSCQVTYTDSTSSIGYGATYTEDAGLPLSGDALGCDDALSLAAGRTPSGIAVMSDDGTTETTLFDQPLSSGTLALLKDGVSCMTWAADCSGWWDDTVAGTVPGPYTCTYGGGEVDLTECSIYRNTFDNRSGGCPTLYDADLDAQVGAICGTDPNSNTPGAVDPVGSSCSSWWPDSFNPIEYVVKPIRCAFVSLFVPNMSAVESAFDGAISKWDNTMPGQIPDLVADTFTVPAGGSGCMGPHVVIALEGIQDGWSDIDFYPLQACDGAMAEVATWARLIGAAVLVYATAVGVVRRVSAVVNAPGIN